MRSVSFVQTFDAEIIPHPRVVPGPGQKLVLDFSDRYDTAGAHGYGRLLIVEGVGEVVQKAEEQLRSRHAVLRCVALDGLLHFKLVDVLRTRANVEVAGKQLLKGR